LTIRRAIFSTLEHSLVVAGDVLGLRNADINGKTIYVDISIEILWR